MKPIDYAKALGIAALVLIVDVLIAIAVVYIYALFVDPGHPESYYLSARVSVARFSTRTFGTALLLGTAWLCGRRRPDRNAYAFAVALTLSYALLDGASAMFVDIVTASFAITIGLKLAGSLVGAFLAARGRRCVTG